MPMVDVRSSELLQRKDGHARLGTASTAEPGLSYTNCASARAAGAAPVHAEDPGYSKRLDRDGDGIGCE